MRLERVELFDSLSQRLLFVLTAFILFCASLGLEFLRYRDLKTFDTAVVEATVLHQYLKQKNGRTYSVLKLRTEHGATFYTTGSKHYRDLSGRTILFELQTERLTFMEYLRGFFSFGRIVKIEPSLSWRERLARAVRSQHASQSAAQLFAALFAATPLPPAMRESFAAYGVSHLIAISGFHLGVLGMLLFWLVRGPYRLAQERWFPYRSRNADLFWFSAAALGVYTVTLDFAPSLLRAFGMMTVGYVLYARGIRILSFQTLLVTIALLLAFWPRLLFSLGFWLSVSGVYYIFVFVKHFQSLGAFGVFVGLHGWVYLMMLPVSLYVFGSFSPWHAVSVPATMAFVVFYPLALALHLIGLGGWLDAPLLWALAHAPALEPVRFSGWTFALFVLLSLGAAFSRTLAWALLAAGALVFVEAVRQIA